MRELGYDNPLYILPFDHRGSFLKMLDDSDDLCQQVASDIVAARTEAASAKYLVYDAFRAALGSGVPEHKAGILVDEQFGDSILRDAVKRAYTTACPVEKSGQNEFEFEYGENFAEHIECFRPTFAKVLVRYNPESDSELNRRQVNRLQRLSDYLHGPGHCFFMFELLVPATKEQMNQVDGDKARYDCELRPMLMIEAIRQLQDSGVEPDVWKIEGLDSHEDCVNIVAAARRDGRHRVGCIVLGRGEDARKVRSWLSTAAEVPGFIGFAVGRTVFWEPLVEWHSRKITRDLAVSEISRRYQNCVHIFEAAQVQMAHAS